MDCSVRDCQFLCCWGFWLGVTMDIPPHTGIRFPVDQVTAVNYLLGLHTVRINPVLVGDYNLLNHGSGHWLQLLIFVSSISASPSTTSTLRRPSEDTSNARHWNLINVISTCIGALIRVLVIVLFIWFHRFMKGKQKTCKSIAHLENAHEDATNHLVYLIETTIA